MRRGVVPALTVVLIGCATPRVGSDAPAAKPPAPAPDVTAALRMPGEVQVVRRGTIGEAGPGIVGLDGETVVTTPIAGTRTEVVWEDLATGSVTGSFTVDGELTAVTTDQTGDLVALAPPAGAASEGQIAPGRLSTEIVVVNRIHGELDRWVLDGNLVPEGFGEALEPGAVPPLFVVQYLPPERPDVYRVLWLDTSTGELQLPVDLRTKGQVDLDVTTTSTPAIAAHDDELWVAFGDELLALDADTLAEHRRVESPVTVDALAALDDAIAAPAA